MGAKQDLGKNTQISFAYRHHRDRFVLFRENPAVYENRHSLQSFQAAIRRRQGIGNNTHLYYGAEGYSDSIHSTNLGDHSRGRAAAYVALDARDAESVFIQHRARAKRFTAPSRANSAPARVPATG